MTVFDRHAPASDLGPYGAPALDELGLPVDEFWLKLYDDDLRPNGCWPRLHTVAYQGLAADVVQLLAPATEADPAAMLLAFLAAFGSAVGPGPHAAVGAAQHPARLNVLIAGDTSRARKGTSWAEVRRLMAIADPRWADERVVGGLASGEGLISALGDASDARLFVVEPEFARTIAVCSREASTLSAVIRQAWDTGELRVMTRKDPLAVAGAHISVYGNITVEELRRRTTDTDAANGYLNRYLHCLAHRARLLPSGGDVDPQALAALGARIRDALDGARRVNRLRRSGVGEVRWGQLYEKMANGPGGLSGAVTARAEAQALRLSVVYALLDGARTIDVDHIEAAWAVWQYCEQSAFHIYGDALGDDIADRLLEAIRAAGDDGLSFTEQSDLFGRHASAKRLTAARAELEKLHLIETKKVPTDGRPRLISVAKQGKQAKEPPR